MKKFKPLRERKSKEIIEALPPLSDEEQRKLIAKAQQGDKEAMSLLVSHNLKLVIHIAARLARSNKNVELEELISMGIVGLMRGVEYFNLEKPVKTVTYLYPVIKGDMVIYIMKKKQEPSISLDAPTTEDGKTLVSLIPSKSDIETEYFDEEQHAEMLEALAHLPTIERFVIRRHYGFSGNCQSQIQIAEVLHMTRQGVSLIDIRAREKIKKFITKKAKIEVKEVWLTSEQKKFVVEALQNLEYEEQDFLIKRYGVLDRSGTTDIITVSKELGWDLDKTFNVEDSAISRLYEFYGSAEHQKER